MTPLFRLKPTLLALSCAAAMPLQAQNTLPAETERSSEARSEVESEVILPSPRESGRVESIPMASSRPGFESDAVALKALLNGMDFPLTLRLRDLDASWRRLSISGQYEMGEWMQMYSSLLGGAPKDAFYTNGQMVSLAGETYIVAYRPQTKNKPLDFAAMMRAAGTGDAKPPAPEKLTPDTTLTLSLLNLRTIGSLNNIRPFDLNAELEIEGKAVPSAPVAPRPAASSSSGTTTVDVNATTDSRLRQLGLAVAMYLQDYDEVLPDMSSAAAVKKVLAPYVKSDAVFLHPGTKKPFKANPSLSKKKLAHIVNPRAMLAFYEEPVAPDGTRGLLFLDGHIKRIEEKEWPKVAKNSKVFGG